MIESDEICRVQQLVGQLLGADVDLAAEAARQLGGSGSTQAVLPLIKRLERSLDSYHLRGLSVAVVEALGELSDRAAEPVLLRALQSPLYPVKSAAAEALGRLAPSDRSVERIKDVIDDDPPREVKKDAIRGLGLSGRPRAAEHLVDVMRRETDRELKHEAVEAIGNVSDPAAALPLEEQYRREADRGLRSRIIETLSEIGTVGSLGLLLDALKDDDPRIRADAALALGAIGLPHTTFALRTLLSDPEQEVRRSAAMALGLIEFLPR
jgi:HEAT repeat protein